MGFELLAKYGIEYPKSGIAASREEAVAIARRVGFPVAMKIVSQKILHKTDVGGVSLDIKTMEEVKATYDDLSKKFSSAGIDGVLVQQMAGKGAFELIVGGKRDSQFGQIIMLGMGGIFVEVFRDFSTRICPITEQDAMEMVNELRARPILEGARGTKPVDKRAIVSTLLKVSKLLEKENPREFDINPLMASESGCVAVDMRIIR